MYQVCIQCTRYVYSVPDMHTVYQVCIYCTRYIYSVPDMYTVYQVCIHCSRVHIQCTRCVYSVPDTYTVYQVYSVPGVYTVYRIYANSPTRYMYIPAIGTSCSTFPAGPVVLPSPCPVGHYCPPGTGIAVSFPCPAGTFGPNTHAVDIDNCTLCTPAYYCANPGLDEPTGGCYAGYYCNGGASSATPNMEMVGTR